MPFVERELLDRKCDYHEMVTLSLIIMYAIRQGGRDRSQN